MAAARGQNIHMPGFLVTRWMIEDVTGTYSVFKGGCIYT